MHAKRSSEAPPPPVRNHLLAAIPPGDFRRISPALDVIPLKLKQFLHRPGEPIEHVYFPGGGFGSMLAVLEDGSMVEVATIGREGLAGTAALHDGSPATSATMVQAEMAICYRMTADAFRREMDRHGAFSQLINRYAQALVGVIMQSTAYNAVHTVEQRLARWLLMAGDRVESHEFTLTQEFVSMMLGVTRPRVTVVAGTLQKAGLIRYHRGRVTIVDRERLEAASCECYRAATGLLKGVIDRSQR